MHRTTMALTFLAVLTGTGAHTFSWAQPSPALPALTAAQLQEDLRYFARELPARHKNAFHTTTRTEFDKAVAELDAAIPTLQGHEFVVGLMRITAMIGDGHTGVHAPASFTLYPVVVFWFGDELRITAALPAYRAALGGKVVKINGMPIGEVTTRMRRIVSQAENEWHFLATSAQLLMRPEILEGLGVVPRGGGSATFTLEHDGGTLSELALAPISYDPKAPPGFVSAAASPLFARRNQGSAFWFAFLPDSQTLYVNWRRYDGLEENARQLFALVDERRVTRLIIDLRQNGGGDFYRGRASMVAAIKKRPAINTAGNLFVIIGRHTFSAALANAVDFRKETNAILVGEPIGERPNSYSENDEMTLPNSKLIVSYSTRYYKFVEEDIPAVLPDRRIDPAWADFKAGRDAVLEWIMSRKG